MNYLLKKGGYVLFFFLFISVGLLAQIDNNRYTVLLNPENLAPCGGANNSLEEVFIRGKNASCDNFSITFDLPDGVEYVAGTAMITTQTGSGDFVIGEGGTAADPVFTLYRQNDPDLNWQVGDEVTFTFERSANCDAVAFLNGGGIFKDAHTIDFVDAGGPNSATDNDITVALMPF